jgi:hypothetical protein
MPSPLSLKAAHLAGWQIRETVGWLSAHHDVYGSVGAPGRTGLLREIQNAVAKWVPPKPPPVRERPEPVPVPDELRGFKGGRYGIMGPLTEVFPLEDE